MLLEVSIGNHYVPLQLSLVQNFVLILQNDISIWKISIGELVQNFELKRVGGAPKSYPFAPLDATTKYSHVFPHPPKGKQLAAIAFAAST